VSPTLNAESTKHISPFDCAADESNTTTLDGTLDTAKKNDALVAAMSPTEGSSELIVNNGHYSREVCKYLYGGSVRAGRRGLLSPGRRAFHAGIAARKGVRPSM
jgi:hypothetical protein